jgi:hypothetical protein
MCGVRVPDGENEKVVEGNGNAGARYECWDKWETMPERQK